MPKGLPLKLLADDSVAARTRLKLGSPIHKSRPVQYPDSWPLLHKAILFSKLQSSRLDLHHENTKSNANDNRKKGIDIDLDLDIVRRPVMKKKATPLVPLTQSCTTRLRRTIGNKKLRSSLIDFVTFKSKKVKNYSGKLNKRARERTQCKSRRKSRRGKPQNSTRNRKSGRKPRKKRKTKTRKKRVTRRKRGLSSRRRKVSKKQNKKRARRLSKGPKRRNRRGRDDSPERRHQLEPEALLKHTYDSILKQKNTVTTESFDKGNDEIKDDPLNINDICRNLVKSLPGIPADCREENFDEKTTRPEHVHASARKNILCKVKSDCAPEKAVNGEDSAPKTKINRCKGKNKRPAAGETQNETIQEYSENTKGNNGLGPVINQTHRITKTHRDEVCQTSFIPVGERMKNQQKGVEEDFETNSSTLKDNSADRKEKRGVRENGEDGEKENNISGKASAVVVVKSEPRCSTDISGEYQNYLQQNHYKSPRAAHRKHKTPVRIVVPYHGKSVPRKRRREDINIIKKQGKNISLLVKRRPRKRISRGLDNSSKRHAARHDRKHPAASARHRNRKVAKHSQRQKDSRRYRRRRNPTADSNANRNNNTSASETERWAWGRVGGRLLRIGRYLLRKFQLIFW
ncbi:hypothetical protein PoB_000601400 [Plakobranchus ocellatus]|uniref:Uncharacterized protein n=1 Tax=Plakobranchus ocellatus TaxID=259542 RepID=A0AAV3YBN8_9GAST|nr:hypothetical protein PoB_000601400 [Plakobranchus ocellatus]